MALPSTLTHNTLTAVISLKSKRFLGRETASSDLGKHSSLVDRISLVSIDNCPQLCIGNTSNGPVGAATSGFV